MKMQQVFGMGIVFLAATGCKLLGNKASTSSAVPPGNLSNETCDVIVAGGTTAGLAAAISAAREFELEGAGKRACLVEPTDWPGGQLTSSAVTAVDFAHHKVPYEGKVLNLSKLTRDVQNNSKVFAEWMNAFAAARGGAFEMSNNPGKCWVSVRCYLPETLLSIVKRTLAQLETKGSLKVFYNSVPKSVTKNQNAIASLKIVQRKPQGGADRARLSQVIADWYSPTSSANFSKNVILLNGRNGQNPAVVDATEWGELMVLSGARYMQGVEATEATPESTNPRCGQAIVYPMAVSYEAQDTSIPEWAEAMPVPYPEHYGINDASGTKFNWFDVWTYRRISYKPSLKAGPSLPSVRGVPAPTEGDISQQNWTLGNDFPYGYLYLSPAEAKAQVDDWRGGVNIKVLEEAEAHAVGWYKYLRANAPANIASRLLPSPVFGTNYGISKVPYIRDTRRSVGVGGFVMKYESEMLDGIEYPDSIGVGSYVPDVHATKNPGCVMPNHVMNANHHPKPFTLALRAHTNSDVPNLLVAGKTMAQTFLVNAATRLHPIEFASGTGAGVLASYMQQKRVTSANVVGSYADIQEVQKRIDERHGTTRWNNVEKAVE
jgi:hypothetical protein